VNRLFTAIYQLGYLVEPSILKLIIINFNQQRLCFFKLIFLGNIAAESASCRNTLISQGILTPLLSILETGKRQAKYLLKLTGVHLAENQPTSSSITYRVIESTAFCLSNLCMGRSSLNLQDIIDCLPYIYNHIKENIAIAGLYTLFLTQCYFIISNFMIFLIFFDLTVKYFEYFPCEIIFFFNVLNEKPLI
jgi:hypothetical protein